MTLKNPIARVVSRIYLEIVRIMPQLVLLFVVYFGFLEPLDGISLRIGARLSFLPFGVLEKWAIWFAVHSSAFRKTQYESAQVLGLSKLRRCAWWCVN